MAWVETRSLSFVARHEGSDTESAARILDALEDLRYELEDEFDTQPRELTVIVHSSSGWLAAAHPQLLAVRRLATPAARRYLAGWTTTTELHVLADAAADRRAAGEESREALRRTPERLYAQIVAAAHSPDLPPPWGPRRFRRYLRWAWLVEGAGQHYSGQSALFRPAVTRRMREGGVPSYPPAGRDAALLGGTLVDLLARERGRGAVRRLLAEPHEGDPRRALADAFDARSRDIERAWHDELRPRRRERRPELGPRTV